MNRGPKPGVVRDEIYFPQCIPYSNPCMDLMLPWIVVVLPFWGCFNYYSTAAYPNNFLYLLLQLHRIIVVGAATPIFNYARITINQASVGNSEMDTPSHTAQPPPGDTG